MADRHAAAGHPFGLRYLSVLGSAVLCYAALGAVLRDMPFYVEHQLGRTAFEVGLVVGAPSLAGAILRPVGGRLADRSAVLGLAGSAGLALSGLVVLSIGQGLAVPALGLLALWSIPTEYQGAAAETFFAYFDGGVGIGGPVVGGVAGAFDPQAALVRAGVAVGSAVPVGLAGRRKTMRVHPGAGSGAPSPSSA